MTKADDLLSLQLVDETKLARRASSRPIVGGIQRPWTCAADQGQEPVILERRAEKVMGTRSATTWVLNERVGYRPVASNWIPPMTGACNSTSAQLESHRMETSRAALREEDMRQLLCAADGDVVEKVHRTSGSGLSLNSGDVHPPEDEAMPSQSMAGLALRDKGRLQRLMDFIKAHIADPVTVADMARASHLSERAVHSLCRRYSGCPPMTMVREIRLEAVRERLLRSPECAITEVALDNGFGHLGRFSNYYRRRYGELPIETIRRGQRSAPSQCALPLPTVNSPVQRIAPTTMNLAPKQRQDLVDFSALVVSGKPALAIGLEMGLEASSAKHGRRSDRVQLAPGRRSSDFASFCGSSEQTERISMVLPTAGANTAERFTIHLGGRHVADRPSQMAVNETEFS